MTQPLKIADKTFSSRLLTGTGKFASAQIMQQALTASATEIVTLALKRVRLDEPDLQILEPLRQMGVQLLPNTSGARNAKEAIFAAQLAREALGTNWLKLEIHPDPRYLMPDPIETFKAAEELCKQGFVVLPYCGADPLLVEPDLARRHRLQAGHGTQQGGLAATRRADQHPDVPRTQAETDAVDGGPACSGITYLQLGDFEEHAKHSR